MGQSCCKPCAASHFCRLAKTKAPETAAVTDTTIRPPSPSQEDPVDNQLLVSSDANLHENTPLATTMAASGTSARSMSPAALELTSLPASATLNGQLQPASSSEVHNAVTEQPSALYWGRTHRGSSRWIQRERIRLVMSRKFGHRYGKYKRGQKIAIACDEAPVSGTHPIIIIMASSDNEEHDHNDVDQGALVVASGQGRLTESPELTSDMIRQPAMQLLCPAPRRPVATRFPFLSQATTSADTTRSSSESQSSLSPSTVIAIQPPMRENNSQSEATGEVDRNSPRSTSLSIYYLAQTSPEMAPIEDQRATAPTAAATEDLNGHPNDNSQGTKVDKSFLSTVLSYVVTSWQRPPA
ncbi:hypothetical protein SEPCBS57363_001877 [Sporothrix epigloea]|uniref:Uncharacterized protein n=1 Tax=Sporothrix epigloea TaxID=1892477 RepID=A0ABP0DED8_9PEZI